MKIIRFMNREVLKTVQPLISEFNFKLTKNKLIVGDSNARKFINKLKINFPKYSIVNQENCRIWTIGESMSEQINQEQPPKWFKEWNKDFQEKLDRRFAELEDKIENHVPKWFITWNKDFQEKLDKRFKKIEDDIAKIFAILQRHEKILNEHTAILQRHEEILARNGLK